MSSERIHPIKPAGMKSDIADPDVDLVEVTNLYIDKENEWQTVKGYLNSKTGLSDVRVAIEVTDDRSGDRFILFQQGYGSSSLKRLDYDDGDGDGYENETASTVTLPSGATIPDVTLKFFLFRGVVRIVGATSPTGIPMWYGYIDETLFPDSWEEIYCGCFENDTESWSGSSATLSKYDCDTDADGAGMVHAPEKVNALKVVQTANTGVTKKTFTVESGKICRFLAMAFRAAGGTGALTIKLGSSDGGSEYGTLITSDEDEWVMLEDDSFTTTGTSLYVELMPSAGAANDTAYFDFIFIEENCPIELDGWYCQYARVHSKSIDLVDIYDHHDVEDEEKVIFGKSFQVLDDAQYTLLKDMDNDIWPLRSRITGIDCEISTEDYHSSKVFVRGFEVEFPGADLENNWKNRRITRLGICLAVYQRENRPFDEDDIVWYVAADIPINEEIGDYNFIREDYYYDQTKKNRIGFISLAPDEVGPAGDGFIARGNRVTYRTNKDTTLETVITEVDDLYYEIAHPIYPNFISVDGNMDFGTGVILERKWIYDSSNGYRTIFGVDLDELVNEFYEYSDLPSGTEETFPDYSSHCVVDGRAYCTSLEDDEGDSCRYSPPNQFDVFPNGNLMQTEIGDADQNLVVLNRDDRIVVLKRNSISQMQFVSASNFHADIGLADHGLYTTKGYLIIDDTLFIMEKDDVYAFRGGVPVPLLETKKLRKFYTQYVDENSFIGFNKLSKELWLFLNGKIMVYQIDRNDWYLRSTNITPKCAFILLNNEFYVAASTGGGSFLFARFNHSESTFSESIGFALKTGLKDQKAPGKWKKVKELSVFCKGNGDITLKVADPKLVADGESQFSGDKTPHTTEIDRSRVFPKKMGKGFEVEIENKTNSTTLDVTIRSAELLVHTQ